MEQQHLTGGNTHPALSLTFTVTYVLQPSIPAIPPLRSTLVHTLSREGWGPVTILTYPPWVEGSGTYQQRSAAVAHHFPALPMCVFKEM